VLIGILLARRLPSLIHVANPSGIAFDENIRLRDLPPVVNNVAGALAISSCSTAMVPNPTASALIRAGDLADRTSYFRNDLAFAATGGAISKNPHTFLTNIANPAAAPFAIGAQTQIALFFATNGALTIDPDGAGPIFEVPIAGPLPERLNFLP